MIIKFIISICLLITNNIGYALLVETNDIYKILEHTNKDSLVVFDLDDTIIEPVQLLGSDSWFENHLKNLTKQGLTIHESLDKTLDIYYKVHFKTDVKLVDNRTPELIKNLQNKKIPTMVLTTRGDILQPAAVKQLKSVNIDFNNGFFKNTYFKIGANGSSSARNGMVFADGKHKGYCLKEYLNHLKFKPKKIIFIDDKLKNTQQVGKIVEDLKIEYVGIRYGKLDYKIKSVDPNIAQIQIEYLNKPLSDKDALTIFKSRNIQN